MSDTTREIPKSHKATGFPLFCACHARVSRREQEREGYSIPAQRKGLGEYTRTNKVHVEREFVDVESAKNPGRKEFGEMLRLLETDRACRLR